MGIYMQENGGRNPAQSEEYADFIIKYNQNVYGPVEELSELEFQILNDNFAIAHLPLSLVGNLEINSYTYNAVPKCYTYMDLESLGASGITRLQNHPYLNLKGRGTAIAVIDSGIDYTNPVFLNGNRTKIMRLWDQSLEGDEDQAVPFGREYTNEEIDLALSQSSPLEIVPSTDTNGHGTYLAATAAGSPNLPENFSGAAPEAVLIIVKLKRAKKYLRDFYLLPEDAQVYQENDIMSGVYYAMQAAQRLNMPLSICIGLGSSQGAHMGDGPLSQYLDSATRFPHNTVNVAGGNEGNARHHHMGEIEEQKKEEVELRVGEDETGFCMEFWGIAPAFFSLSLRSPTGEELEISTAGGTGMQVLSYIFVETKIEVSYVSMERQSGNTLLFFRFLNPASGIWKFTVETRNDRRGVFHMWLPVQPLVSGETYFLESTPYYTITNPGDASDVITWTAYNYRDESLYLQASRGYTPGGIVKPDLAAPGVEIRIPLLNGQFAATSGTSLAAAYGAGATALLFEGAIVRKNAPYFNGTGAKGFLIRGARRKETLTYPNPEWGYGILDLYHTFEILS